MINHDESIQETTINVARQIRTLREFRSLSQQDLAEASGLSRNTLSLLERGQTSPTVSTLKRLANALDVNINAFFEPYEMVNLVYTKSKQRAGLELKHGVMADLGAGMLNPLMTPLVLKLEPGARSGEAISHEGQDFVYCLQGEVLYSVNGQTFLLEAGDSIIFDGNLPHRFQNTGTASSEILIMLSTPQESSHYIAGHFPDETITEKTRTS